MTKFKVGDKVIFNKENTYVAKKFDYKINKPYEVQEVIPLFNTVKIINEKGSSRSFDEERFKLVETKPTKNQRIAALENEVAELKLIVHELRERPQLTTIINNSIQGTSATNTVEDIIEFEGKQYRKVDREARKGDVVVFDSTIYPHNAEPNKPYIVNRETCLGVAHSDSETAVHVKFEIYDNGRTPKNVYTYELIKQKPITPNQKRAAIIEKAKEFVKNTVGEYDTFDTTVGIYKDQCVRPIFHVNEKKRAITVLIYGAFSKELIFKGITKCNPSDVFNEHIGKAIALGRALGLDVSEFEQAVQPSKVVMGMKLKSTRDWTKTYGGKIHKGDIIDVVRSGMKLERKQCHANSGVGRNSKISDDTNAIY